MSEVLDFVEKLNGFIIAIYESPNGRHIITTAFDRKVFSEKFPEVEVLVDGYYFIGFAGKKEQE